MLGDQDLSPVRETALIDEREMRKRLGIDSYKGGIYVRHAFRLGVKPSSVWLFSEDELKPFYGNVPFDVLKKSVVYPGNVQRWKALNLDGNEMIDIYAAAAYTGWCLGWPCAKTPRLLRQLARKGVIGNRSGRTFVFSRSKLDMFLATELQSAPKEDKRITPRKEPYIRDPQHWLKHGLDGDERLTTERAAKYLGLTRQAIAERAKSGFIGVQHPHSKKWFYTRRELDAFYGQPHLPPHKRVTPDMRATINIEMSAEEYTAQQAAEITGLSKEAFYKAYERGQAGRRTVQTTSRNKHRIHFTKADIETIMNLHQEIPLKVSRYAFKPVPVDEPIKQGGWCIQANNIGKVISLADDIATVRWLEPGTHHKRGLVVTVTTDTLKAIEEPRLNIALATRLSSLSIAELREANETHRLGAVRQPFWITPSELAQLEKSQAAVEA